MRNGEMKGGGVKGEKGRWKHRWGEEERKSGRQKSEKETWRRAEGKEGEREKGSRSAAPTWSPLPPSHLLSLSGTFPEVPLMHLAIV